jgi:hypothetical protein
MPSDNMAGTGEAENCGSQSFEKVISLLESKPRSQTTFV